MANLKAMHSISEVMQTPINSFVLIMCEEYLNPVLVPSSLKEKCTRPLKSNQPVESVYCINVLTLQIIYILNFLPANDALSTSTVFI